MPDVGNGSSRIYVPGQGRSAKIAAETPRGKPSAGCVQDWKPRRRSLQSGRRLLISAKLAATTIFTSSGVIFYRSPIAARVYSETGVELDLETFADHPTVADLAGFVHRHRGLQQPKPYARPHPGWRRGDFRFHSRSNEFWVLPGQFGRLRSFCPLQHSRSPRR